MAGATGIVLPPSVGVVEFDAVIAPGGQLTVLPPCSGSEWVPDAADNVRTSGLTSTA